MCVEMHNCTELCVFNICESDHCAIVTMLSVFQKPLISLLVKFSKYLKKVAILGPLILIRSEFILEAQTIYEITLCLELHVLLVTVMISFKK